MEKLRIKFYNLAFMMVILAVVTVIGVFIQQAVRLFELRIGTEILLNVRNGTYA